MNIKKLNKEDFTPEELERCETDPVYFYNKYIRRPDQKELTRTEWEEYKKR